MTTPDASNPLLIPPGVEVVATLVIDPRGRVRDGLDSRLLSSPEDRTRFLDLRRQARCIVIGSQTWSAESYSKSKVPVLVYSRSDREIIDWKEEVARIKNAYGTPILVEAGPGLLGTLIRSSVVERLYLTRTTRQSSDVTSPTFEEEAIEENLELVESIQGREDRFEVYQKFGIER